MKGYVDDTFNCNIHPNSKRIKSTTTQIMKTNQIYEVVIGPFVDINQDTIFKIIPNYLFKSIHRFIYPDVNTGIITVPLIASTYTHLPPHSILFTLSSTNLAEIVNTLEEEDIFYSDTEDDDDDDDDDNNDDDDETKHVQIPNQAKDDETDNK
jgi:hypothetical protein